MKAIPIREPRHAGRRSSWTSSFSDFVRIRVVGIALGSLALATVLWPRETLVMVFILLSAMLAAAAPRAIAAAVGLILIAVALAAWPGFTTIVIAVLTVGALAWRAPLWGFAAGLVVFAAEGSIKAVLSYSPSPVAASPVALGAIVTDLALAIGVTGLLVADRGSSLRAIWERLGTYGRVSAALLTVWLLASLVQIPLSARLTSALLGFRVTQSYAVAILAGVALAALARERAKTFLLLAISPIVFYSALRVIIGPSSAERTFTSHRPGVTQYGEAIRATGSFSGAVGLVSFVVPAAALAIGLVVVSSRNRLWAWLLIVCSLTAIVASYTRAALVATAGAAVLSVVLLFWVGPRSPRRRVVALAVCTALSVAVAGATVLTSTASPQVRQRVDAVLHPERDLSLRMRLDTWQRIARSAWEHPLGAGLGTVGRASGTGGALTVTADESYLKMLYEQGLAVGSLFIGGVLAACAAIVAALRRCTAEARPLGIAALGGFVAFLILGAFGEYVEQPGKALAWTLLGVAAWEAHRESEPIP